MSLCRYLTIVNRPGLTIESTILTTRMLDFLYCMYDLKMRDDSSLAQAALELQLSATFFTVFNCVKLSGAELRTAT